MCGICGIALLKEGQAPKLDTLRAMTSLLAHRGPDGTGYYLGPTVGLGHSRLSIIDIEGGAQPIPNEDRTVWVVLNGEIFNYIELRNDLEAAGHRFSTASDTEVIVHLYEEKGDALVEDLNGQFAFALWDSRKQRLLLARDRVGIAPLHYREERGRIAFASEMKSLFAASETAPALDPETITDIFSYWSPVGERTTFAGVRELPPGHIMTVSQGSVRVRPYWDWSFPAPGEHRAGDEEHVAEELRRALTDAVSVRLRADVPVAAYLSGGLDSSAIAGLIKATGKTNLRTFSIGFDGAGWDEGIYQKEVVNYLGIKHSHFQCSGDAIASEFIDTIWHTETPILRTAPVPMKLLSARVRQEGYRVVLTGEGADEAFGGYDIFKENKIRQFWSRMPDSALRPRLLERLYPYLSGSTATSGAYLRAFYGYGLESPDLPWFSHLPRWRTTSQTRGFLNPDLLAHSRSTRNRLEHLLETLERADRFNRAEYLEAKILLPRYLLSSQGDRMLMANGIEGRFPYLDHRILEQACRYDPRLKMKVLDEKHLLKKAVAPYVPRSVARRKKQPYRAPDIPALVQPRPPDYLSELMSPEVVQRYGYFNPKKVDMLVRKALSGKAVGNRDNMAFVGILSTQVLHYLFIENFSNSIMFNSKDSSCTHEQIATGA